MSTERVVKFRVVYRNEVNGYERLTQKDGSIHWEWMCLGLNPDNGTERWCQGVYPNGYKYIRNQFTGLLDKNGKEIYEGDRVRILYTDWPSNSNPNISLEDYKKSISNYGSVVWDNETASWGILAGAILEILHGAHGEIEVIGHIYSRPSPIKENSPENSK